MEQINAITSYTINQWEIKISNRPEIEINEFQLHRGLVCGAKGTVTVNGKSYRVQWLHNGRCYYNGKRARQYDVAL